MKKTNKRLDRERKTIVIMISMFCRNNHNNKDGLCEECVELSEYANLRLESCVYGEKKPICAKCHIHCYKPDMREKVRRVMFYSGPRMIYTHFILGMRHLFARFRKIENIPRSRKI